MGHQPIGNDVNPLSVLFTRPRLEPPTINEVARRLDQIKWNKGDYDNPELLAFYSPQTLRHICALRRWLIQRAPLNRTPDPVDDWIRMVAINRLSGHSPGFFSVYTLPPNQAVSAESQRKINERRGQTPQDRDVKKLILRKTVSLLSDGPMAIASIAVNYQSHAEIDTDNPHRFSSVGRYVATVSRYCSVC